MKKFYTVFAGALLSVCAYAQAGDLKIGATPVPHAEILEFVKPMLAEQGVNLEVVEFNDYVQPNLATDDGSIDGNFFQHKPYLDTFNKDHNLDLVSLAGVHIEPMGLYSHKIKSLSELKDGATIAIPNDPTNGGRALLLLAQHKIISLTDNNNITATVFDIADNPKNLKFTELESALLPRSIDDVDAAVINTNFAMQANLNPLKDAIIIEGADSPYVNILVVKADRTNDPDLKKLVDALLSKQTKDFILNKYNGAVVPAF